MKLVGLKMTLFLLALSYVFNVGESTLGVFTQHNGKKRSQTKLFEVI